MQVYYTSNDDSELKVNAVKDIFKNLNIQKHTIDMMKAHYTKAMKRLGAVNSDNKQPLILFSDKLMERIS